MCFFKPGVTNSESRVEVFPGVSVCTELRFDTNHSLALLSAMVISTQAAEGKNEFSHEQGPD